MRRLGIAAALAAGLAAMPAAAQPAACGDFLPGAAAVAGAPRPVRPGDLVRLRDIGPVGPLAYDAPVFTVSPDGRRLAFQLRRADPATNSYCLAMLVLPIARNARPRIVDTGGDLIRLSYDFRGLAAFPTGLPLIVTPYWSPDGRWIAFLKRTDGTTRVWRADAGGAGSGPLTPRDMDVEDFRIGPDGQTIVFATRPGLAAARARIAREGAGGFHYDARFSPTSSDRPFPPVPIPREVHVLDIAAGTVRPARADEAAMLGPGDPAGAPRLAVAGGRRALLGPRPGTPSAPPTLQVEGPDGTSTVCPDPACAGDLSSLMWTADGQAVRYIRREGWARSASALYEWVPGAPTARRLEATDDFLVQCATAGEALACLREGALQPRYIERIVPGTGARQRLFDPNPEWTGLATGPAQRLRWTNRFGLEAVGDLVLPVGYRPGRRYPLIVVQYDTRGFLRGGTGDEYPVQAFAGRGYAVLSVSRPAYADAIRPDLRIPGEPDMLTDRRSLAASLETGIAAVVARGVADPARVGITGMSNGATAATFALLSGQRFAAAALSNCCIDTSLPTRVGPGAARHFYAEGYPPLIARDHPLWREMSLALNARRIGTPILLQLADSEYMSALESYTALREAGQPIDMFVFPDEQHVKWQPAHRLAVYERALDWFDFWLRGLRAPAPGRQAELAYWDRLRAEAGSARPLQPSPPARDAQ